MPTPEPGRSDPPQLVHGARAVTGQALRFAPIARDAQPALVNGTPGLIAAPHGQPISVMGVTMLHGKIVEIDILADPERLLRLNLTAWATDHPAT